MKNEDYYNTILASYKYGNLQAVSDEQRSFKTKLPHRARIEIHLWMKSVAEHTCTQS